MRAGRGVGERERAIMQSWLYTTFDVPKMLDEKGGNLAVLFVSTRT